MECPVRWMKYCPKPAFRDVATHRMINFPSGDRLSRAHAFDHRFHSNVTGLADYLKISRMRTEGDFPTKPVQVMS